MLRTVCERPTLWESVLPAAALGMPAELAVVDRLLDDPGLFEPFRDVFDPVRGRPSIPVETYLRLMFLKYRYRLGYETLCTEVTDSLTWARFCRIPIGARAPHPTTLMKITTRCGPTVIARLNARLVAIAVDDGVVDVSRVRADTTVVPADIKYPTDSGLLTKGISRIGRLVARLHAEGIAPRAEFTDCTADARRHAHAIGSKLRRRHAEARDEVLAITGDLADLAQTVCDQAKRVLVNARRMRDRPVRRLVQMLADLARVLDAVDQIIGQIRTRIAGEVPPGKTRRVSLHDDDARPIRKGSLATPTQFGYTGQVVDNNDGIVLDYELEAGMPADAPRLAPAIERISAAVGATPTAVTADRGYGEAAVDQALTDLGVAVVAIPRKGKPGIARQSIEQADDFVELVKWRTGSEGRIAALKRQHGWNRTRLRGLDGARTWCGWGVFSHNAIKIAGLTTHH